MSASIKPSLLLRRAGSALVAIDLQERLAPAIEGIDAVLANARRLLSAAERLAVPVLITEHYPTGLGHTVPAVQEVASAAQTLEKTAFGALAEESIAPVFEELAEAGRRDFVLLGTEAHVCMMQTGLQILECGWRLAVVEDACGSRRPSDKAAALARLEAAGALRVTTEMVLFEWLERGATEEFRELLPLIRDG